MDARLHNTSHDSTHHLLGDRVSWGLGIGLGTAALLRPLTRITLTITGAEAGPVVPLLLTGAITILWALAIGLRPRAHALLTGLVAGLAYAVFAIALSGIASPILDGRLDGPLAHPAAIIPMLVTNAVWGTLAGVLALGVRALRGRR